MYIKWKTNKQTNKCVHKYKTKSNNKKNLKIIHTLCQWFLTFFE